MLLTDGKTVLSYFEKYPRNTNVGLALSGGVDSALLLFLFTKMAIDRGDDIRIIPIHGYDTMRRVAESWKTAEQIVTWIQEYFDHPKQLWDVNMFTYRKTGIDKEKHHKPHFERLKKAYDLPVIVRGMSQGMPHRGRPVQELQTDKQLYDASAGEDWMIFPWGTIDKKFIFTQYEKYGIMDLSLLTVSCIGDPGPCGKCFWCKERKWAFGNYDGGGVYISG